MNRLIVFALAVVLSDRCFDSSSTEASHAQTNFFLRTLEARGFPYSADFWHLGLSSVSFISFRKGSVNQYRPFLNSLTLSDSMSAQGRHLKAFHQISQIDLGILAHESFHAFLANHTSSRSPYSYIRNWMELRSVNLYPDLPASKAFVALEEAYALFIDQLVTSARFLEHQISRSAQSGRLNCDALLDTIERSWELEWNRPVYGYYYRDSYREYYGDRIQNAWAWITGSEPPDFESEYYVEISIQNADRNWISREILNSQFTEDPWPLFAEDLVAIGCLEPEEI